MNELYWKVELTKIAKKVNCTKIFTFFDKRANGLSNHDPEKDNLSKNSKCLDLIIYINKYYQFY